MRIYRVCLITLVLLAALAAPGQGEHTQAQGTDLQVWIVPLNQENAAWLVEYRDAAGQTQASYTLPSVPLYFDVPGYGRLVGTDSNNIALFDPFTGQLQYYSSPGMSAPSTQDGSGASITAVVMSPDGRYAYTVTRQPQDYEQPALSRIFLAGAGADNDRQIYELEHESFLSREPFAWRADGGALLLHDMPQGIGGYILFWTYTNVHTLDLATGNLTFLADSVNGVSSDFSLIATLERDDMTNAVTAIAITDFATGFITRFPVPDLGEVPAAGGGAVFSPDNRRVAYQVARQNPENEKFWTIVVDLTSGTSSVVLADEATGYDLQYGTIGGWLDSTTLVVGDFWKQNAVSAIVDTTTGTLIRTAPGAFAGFVPGVSSAERFAPSGLVSITCTGAPVSRLTVNGRGRVTFTDGTATNVRDAPSMDANKIATIPEGAEFNVSMGPVCASGLAWWSLNFDNGAAGWVAEGTPDSYFLEPWP